MAEKFEQKAVWLFKSIDESVLRGDEVWIKFRDIEMEIIEDAYRKGKSDIALDNYRIDFEESVQIDKKDSTKKQLVERVLMYEDQHYLRECRFRTPPSFTMAPSYGKLKEWCPFLSAWLKTPMGMKSLIKFETIIDACIEGILKEAELHESHSMTEANWMVEQLKACKTKSRREISRLCIHLYTRESFLYRILNAALRESDFSKLETLGPLCFLIRDYSRTCSEFVGTVYRGLDLTMDMINSYKQALGTWRTWPSYTSTSKDRSMAELLGNTLFIIEITELTLNSPRSYDLTDISQFPSEKEVLLPAGTSFLITDVEINSNSKHIVRIKL